MRRVLLIAMLTIQASGPAAASAGAQADLVVELTAPPTASVPDEVRIAATVTNLGPGDASGVQLTAALPAGLVPMALHPGPWTCGAGPVCALDSLPAGSAVGITVDAAAVHPGSLSSSAQVMQSEGDPEPTNDEATVVVEASGRPCHAIGTAGPDSLRAKGRGEVACGLRGEDVLAGARGRQVLLGGPGRDALEGGRGRDRLDGGAGRDACTRAGRGCEVLGFAMASSLPAFEIAPGTVGYGYHQSLFRTALAMRPLLPHRVMTSRGRGTPSSSAVDVVVPSRARIRAPVTGRVTAVKRYLLYCRTRDWKVVIAPRSHPRLRVLVLHMAHPVIRDGDEVVAGSTVLGRAARNDQPGNQVNRYFPDRFPHVHVEVERNRASPTPGCAL